jgi:hypothetical protein
MIISQASLTGCPFFTDHYIRRSAKRERHIASPSVMNTNRLIRLFLACLLLASCATNIPKDYDRSFSTALTEPDKTELGRFFQPDVATHPGKSGVLLVPTGEWGFRATNTIFSICCGLSLLIKTRANLPDQLLPRHASTDAITHSTTAG